MKNILCSLNQSPCALRPPISTHSKSISYTFFFLLHNFVLVLSVCVCMSLYSHFTLRCCHSRIFRGLVQLLFFVSFFSRAPTQKKRNTYKLANRSKKKRNIFLCSTIKEFFPVDIWGKQNRRNWRLRNSHIFSNGNRNLAHLYLFKEILKTSQ